MKILVTGGRGFVGREIVKALKNISSHSQEILNPTRQECDLLNQKSILNYIQEHKPEIVIHSAWYTEPGKFWNSEENQKWLEASKYLVDQFYKNGGLKFFGLGTCAEYEWQNSTICEEDNTALKPATIYGKAKVDLLQYVQKVAQSNNRDWLWGRVFFPYGPDEKSARIVPLMIHALIRQEEVTFQTNGYQKRDFIFVEDLGLLIAEIALDSKIPNGAYNLGTGEAVSIRQVAEILSSLCPSSKDVFRYSGEPLKEPELLTGSLKKRDQALTWKPRHSIAKGLEKTFNWWLENSKNE